MAGGIRVKLLQLFCKPQLLTTHENQNYDKHKPATFKNLAAKAWGAMIFLVSRDSSRRPDCSKELFFTFFSGRFTFHCQLCRESSIMMKSEIYFIKNACKDNYILLFRNHEK